MNPLLNSFMQMAMQSNDMRAKKALELIQNGDIEAQKQMAENLCKACGMSPEEVINRINSLPGTFINNNIFK